MSAQRPTGMVGFTLVWLGQLVSVLASNAASFALAIWAYETTGRATALGVLSASFLVPFLVLSPIAGAMVDRYNRKAMMMVSDLAAAAATTAVLVLHATGSLSIGHLYLTTVLVGLGNTFQWPAYSAAISTMIPKRQYQRANGMMSLVDSGPGVLAPLLAGALYPVVGLTGLLLLDIGTFALAVAALVIVEIPTPPPSAEGAAARGHLLHEAVYGFRYIFARKGLLGLAIFFATLNFFAGMGLMTPFILSRTQHDSAALGIVMSAAALGGVAGGLLVSAWGGFRRRITNVFVGEFLFGFLSLFLFGFGRGLAFWIPTAALGSLAVCLSNSAAQAIWQAKVPADLQGRVFSARRLIAFSLLPITPVVAGALADYVTEPAMRTAGGGLARTFGWMLGATPGAGLGLQYVIAGLLYCAGCLVVFFWVPAVRHLEDRIPDHAAALGDSAGVAQPRPELEIREEAP
ncbi:MAG: MFS transporter [Candidatus Bipolaricaulota bacterium]